MTSETKNLPRFVAEWARGEQEERIRELQARNRAMTNEKNRFLTMVESHSDPALLLDRHGMITYLNPAARDLAGLDLCRVCGSGVATPETSQPPLLVACVDCGECYHTFCVGSTAALGGTTRRWSWRCAVIWMAHAYQNPLLLYRCPHCTICEECEAAGAEDKLLVCDACDGGCGTCFPKPKARPPASSLSMSWTLWERCGDSIR